MSDNESARSDGPITDQSESAENITDMDPSAPKRIRLNWQEALISLVSTQQEQLAELTRQTKMAASPAPTPSTSISGAESVSAHALTSANVRSLFKLTSYDPDTSAYSIEARRCFQNKRRVKRKRHPDDR